MAILMLYDVVIIHLTSSSYFPRKNWKIRKRYCLCLIVVIFRWSLLGFEACDSLKRAGLRFTLMLGRLLFCSQGSGIYIYISLGCLPALQLRASRIQRKPELKLLFLLPFGTAHDFSVIFNNVMVRFLPRTVCLPFKTAAVSLVQTALPAIPVIARLAGRMWHV